MFADQAMDRVLRMEWTDGIDIGCGDGTHTRILAESAPQRRVVSVDYGRSIYAQRAAYPPTVVGDFMASPEAGSPYLARAYDLVWCSHVLEHMPDSRSAIRRLAQLCRPSGILAITVPPRKDEIVGGHLSIWNAGLLVYAMCAAGLDMSDCRIGTYGYNCSVIVHKRMRPSVGLENDSGDIIRLRQWLPPPCRTEPYNGWIEGWRWT